MSTPLFEVQETWTGAMVTAHRKLPKDSPDPASPPMSAEIPELSGFTEVYGMQVSSIGEDGDMVILGHHQPLYALAALNEHAVDVLGLQDVYDGLVADPGPTAVKAISLGWASLVTACDEAGEPDHEDDCYRCIEISESSWWMEIGQKERPNAFPVTYFSA